MDGYEHLIELMDLVDELNGKEAEINGSESFSLVATANDYSIKWNGIELWNSRMGFNSVEKFISEQLAIIAHDALIFAEPEVVKDPTKAELVEL